ncbi:MAG: urea carboxylase-associated family protein [Proteobacteria bacterium]|nr:MAG: urea carboxylase-associated family protein [Pseudomonadota bacterium]
MKQTISPRSGTAFLLPKGHLLKIVDPEGEQVCDFLCYNARDTCEVLSSGRTLDYASRLFLTQGDKFYSNRSEVMFEILEDTCGRHDFLLTPCSAETFKIIYGHSHPHKGCFGNLRDALAAYDISGDEIPTTFNVFMNVEINGETGELAVKPPKSRAGDYILVRANMDLIVGLTACSAEQSNNFSFKPIQFEVIAPTTDEASVPRRELNEATL